MGHRSRLLRKQNKGSASAIAIILGLVRVGLPLLLIAAAAFYFINFRAADHGQLRVTASQPAADILIGGVQTGYTTDATLQLGTGRKLVTVRKPNFVSEPEFAVAEITPNSMASLHFVLTRVTETTTPVDTIQPLHPVRQNVFSTGEAVHIIPPAGPRRHKRLVDYRSKESTRSQSTALQQTETVQADALGAQIAVASQPDGARIRINGELTNRTTPATFRGQNRGVYVFRAELDGFQSSPDSAVVAIHDDQQRELVSFVLIENRTLPKPTITVTTSPLAAGIKIDGIAAGVGSAKVETTYGSHRVDFADVAGYITPAPVTVHVTASEPNIVQAGVYVRITGNAYVAVLPDDEFRSFSSSQLRVYVDNELLLDNPNSQFDAALLGRIVSGKRLIRVQYGDLQSEAYVTLLDGDVAEVEFRVETFFSKRSLKLRPRAPVALDKWEKKVERLTVYSGT